MIDEETMDAVLSAARHEAAHAVMACIGQIPFRYVTTEIDDDSSGHIFTCSPAATVRKAFTVENFDHPRKRQRIENVLMFRLAGYVMDAMDDGLNPERTSATDLKAAEDLLALIIEDEEERDAYLAWLISRTKSVLLKPWHSHAVDMIAEALSEAGTLSPSEVLDLYTSALEAWRQA